MPYTSVNYTFNFSSSVLGWTYSGANPGFFTWDSTEQAMSWWGPTNAGALTNVASSPATTWQSMGVPAGMNVVYVDFSVTVRGTNGQYNDWAPGVAGQSVPTPTRTPGTDENYHALSFACPLFCVSGVNQPASTPVTVTLAVGGEPATNGRIFVKSVALSIYYQASPLNTCGDNPISAGGATVPAGASLGLSVPLRPMSWSVTSGPGSVSPGGPSLTTTYTAPVGAEGLVATVRAVDPDRTCYQVTQNLSITAEGPSPPSPGRDACDGTLSVNGLFAVAADHQTPYLLIARKDINQIAMLDLYTPTIMANILWYTLPIDGGPEARTWKKRFRRLRVYGEGTLDTVDAGTVTFVADLGQRQESYPVTTAYADPTQKILLLQETSPDLVGRQVEVRLKLNGTGILIREVQMEFVRIN